MGRKPDSLAALRIEATLTLREAGRLCGVSYEQVRRWESGLDIPDTIKAARYAEVLGITQSRLNELLSLAAAEKRAASQ